MAMFLHFGIQQLAVDTHFEPAAFRWHERHRFDHVLIVLQQFLCQAHGPAGVMSDCTVNDLNLQHVPSAKFGRLYH
jgi:hypothetical protein